MQRFCMSLRPNFSFKANVGGALWQRLAIMAHRYTDWQQENGAN